MTAYEQDCTETIETVDNKYMLSQYDARVLDYFEGKDNSVSLTLKVSKTLKTTIDNALAYSGKLVSFNRPFASYITYDSTIDGDSNIISFNILDCPSGVSNPLNLIVKDYKSKVVIGLPFYVFNITGYKFV